jgi:hypothetical protein
MTDERYENEMQPGVYDDDRLLACALGLEQDPELLAAAAEDDELGARLAAMRAEVAAIGAQISAAVPEPDESYADLSGERWAGLGEYFEAPAAAAPRRERRWWRVLAPVTALVVLAVVVGVIAVNGGGGGSGSSSLGSAAQSAEDSATQAQSYGGSGVTKSGSSRAPGEATDRAPIPDRLSDQLGRFAVVVLARARQVTGAVQRFAVLRIFKGSAPEVVELVVNDQPTAAGRLHLLLLDPTATPEALAESPWPLTESPAPASGSPLPASISPAPEPVSPEPSPSLAAGDFPAQELPVAYTYHGEPTAQWELAPGVDPREVDIVIP